ncbi:hypothetical protein LCGC14_1524600 [marine sediment metagenome]|uniref:Uncharacterized protein n=1 Tax=marine sediment metagenome TaxID=412755 RepID=A0A0F9LD33_9ZZZZ
MVKEMGKIKSFFRDTPAILIMLICLLMVVYVGVALTNNPLNDRADLPTNIAIEYKTVENTGGLGSAQYFLFDTMGNRYHVSQELFDSYKDLPRK